MTFPRVHPTLLTLLNERDQSVATPTLDHCTWNQLAQDAEQHGLTPWLYRWSCDHPSAAPSHVHDRLKTHVATLAGKNLVLADELTAILRELARRGISGVPLRGFSLAHYLPDAPSVRPMGDLDLLVRRENYSGVREALQQLGYVEMDRRPGFAEAHSYTLEFVKDRHGWITVEPHWTIAYPPFMDSIDMNGVWNRCRRDTVTGVETWFLSREDLLVNLCWHLHHKGAAAPLLWWYELDQLVCRNAVLLDWPLFSLTAGQGAHAGFLGGILGTLARELHSPVPAHVIAEMSASASSRTPRSARLFTGQLTVDGVESLAQFLAIPGLRAKTRYAWALLVPSREFMLMHDPPTSPALLYARYAGRALACLWASFKGLVNLLLPARRPSLP